MLSRRCHWCAGALVLATLLWTLPAAMRPADAVHDGATFAVVRVHGSHKDVVLERGGTDRVLVHDVVGSLGWSPDGETILFSRDSEDRSSEALATVDVSSGRVRAFTALALAPSPIATWEWTSSRVAYVKDRNTVGVVDVASGAVREFNAADDEGGIYCVRWSPTEDLLAITAYRDNGITLRIVRGDGSFVTQIAPSDQIVEPSIGCASWAPDGSALAVATRNGIAIWSTADGAIEFVDGPRECVQDDSPVWLRTGVVFARSHVARLGVDGAIQNTVHECDDVSRGFYRWRRGTGAQRLAPFPSDARCNFSTWLLDDKALPARAAFSYEASWGAPMDRCGTSEGLGREVRLVGDDGSVEVLAASKGDNLDVVFSPEHDNGAAAPTSDTDGVRAPDSATADGAPSTNVDAPASGRSQRDPASHGAPAGAASSRGRTVWYVVSALSGVLALGTAAWLLGRRRRRS